MEVNIHEAKTHLLRLIERVASGEEIMIAKAGKPVAKLVPLGRRPKKRTLDSVKGEFTVPDVDLSAHPQADAAKIPNFLR